MLYTYVLQSEKDDKFYVGFTKDLKLLNRVDFGAPRLEVKKYILSSRD